ncbi:MAG: YlxR family protein [Eubacteriales bacterium]|nr:YlxR family protein [Eubacteriales bacterium]
MPKHIPVRQCVSCRTAHPKRELLRIVFNQAGEIDLDPTGKKPGRGAYICRTRECLELAIRAHKLDRSLKTKIDEQVIAALVAQLEALPKRDDTSDDS